MEYVDQMELFSVASWIYLFLRKDDGVTKSIKVLTLVHICCQSCTKFASDSHVFHHKTHLHVKKKNPEVCSTFYIFEKGIKTLI